MNNTFLQIKCPECNHIGSIPISYLIYKTIKCSNCRKSFSLPKIINRHIVSLVFKIDKLLLSIKHRIEILDNGNELFDSLIEEFMTIREYLKDIETIQNSVADFTIINLNKVKKLTQKIQELKQYNNELLLINEDLVDECSRLEQENNDTDKIKDQKIFDNTEKSF